MYQESGPKKPLRASPAAYVSSSSAVTTSASIGTSGARPVPPNQPPSLRVCAVRDGLPLPPGLPFRKRALTMLRGSASKPAQAFSKLSS